MNVKPLPAEDLQHVERHTRALWDRARGKRIFLTGATGFFGAWLLESLAYCNRALDLNLSASVLCRDPETVLTRLPHLREESSIHWLQGDVRDFRFPQGEFEFVVHGAAPTTSANKLDPLDLLSTIIDGTKRTIAFAREGRAKHFLFVSSGAVYGPQPESITHISEEYRGGPDWTHPDSAYAEAKRVGEMMCTALSQQSAIGVGIARCFAFVGPRFPLDQHFAVGNFIADAMNGRDILIRGDGSPMRSYLYGGDLAIWLWTILFRAGDAPGSPGIYNVGSGEAISIRELAEQVIAELNPQLRIEVSQARSPVGPRLQYVPDVRRAEEHLGLRQHIGLREAIRRTAAWYR
jgi:nucleoside-diphosphate-sugar epimerase